MKGQVKFEPSAEAQEFRWLRSCDSRLLRYAALAVAAITIGLDLYEYDWEGQTQNVRITVQDPEGAASSGLLTPTLPADSSPEHPVEGSK